MTGTNNQRGSRWQRFIGTIRALFGPGVGAAPRQAIGEGYPREAPSVRYPNGAAFRDDILARYPFTPEAREVLHTVRFEVKNLREPVGGGGWYGPRARRIVLEGVQDEAAVHELAHAWADLTGFYQERAPGGPAWAVLNRPFRAAVHAAADHTDPSYGRVQFLAHQYEYGDPAINFPGMGENDSERFAGLASGTMGDLRLMPPELAHWYHGLFTDPRDEEAGGV
jgi:hypothetical protein